MWETAGPNLACPVLIVRLNNDCILHTLYMYGQRQEIKVRNLKMGAEAKQTGCQTVLSQLNTLTSLTPNSSLYLHFWHDTLLCSPEQQTQGGADVLFHVFFFPLACQSFSCLESSSVLSMPLGYLMLLLITKHRVWTYFWGLCISRMCVVAAGLDGLARTGPEFLGPVFVFSWLVLFPEALFL